MNQRMVITGMGAVTPIGIGAKNYWRGILAGECGVAPITGIPTKDLSIGIAAEVKHFRARDYLSTRLATDMDLFMQYAYIAAEEALKQSGIDPASSRVGIVMGTALAGMTLTCETQEEILLHGERAGPRFLTKILGNMAACQLSMTHHITGPSLTVSTACSSGGDAVVTASLLLTTGAADAVVVMAGESAITPLFIDSLVKAGAMSKTGRSLPFDRDRDGFVAGEGGGALILETEEHALTRGATVLAELLGSACNSDAFNPVSPHPEGAGGAACMRLALSQGGLSPKDIGYVNAHGTATLAGDAAEVKALRAVFGADCPPVSSTKGATGHMMGAGGITEVIACIEAVRTGRLPYNVGCDNPDFDLDLIVKEPRRKTISTAMSNALGFGGQNSTVIVGKYEP